MHPATRPIPPARSETRTMRKPAGSSAGRSALLTPVTANDVFSSGAFPTTPEVNVSSDIRTTFSFSRFWNLPAVVAGPPAVRALANEALRGDRARVAAELSPHAESSTAALRGDLPLRADAEQSRQPPGDLLVRPHCDAEYAVAEQPRLPVAGRCPAIPSAPGAIDAALARVQHCAPPVR